MPSRKRKQNFRSVAKLFKQYLFFVGIIIFALGLILAFFMDMPSPLSSTYYQSNNLTFIFPFLNWITIAGILVATIAVLAEVVKRKVKKRAN